MNERIGKIDHRLRDLEKSIALTSGSATDVEGIGHIFRERTKIKHAIESSGPNEMLEF